MMSNNRPKFNTVSQRAKLPKEPVPHAKPRSPISQLKSIARCGDSIKQLEKVRIEKEELLKALPNKPTMNVWERLSKAKRSLNENGQVVGNPYRHELCIKARQEMNIYKTQPTYRVGVRKTPQGILGFKKEPQRPFLRKTLNFGTGDQVLTNKSMTDLMLPRQMSDSLTSMGNITTKNSSKSLGSIYTEKSNNWNDSTSFVESEETFQSATSMIKAVISKESVSARIAEDFRTALEKRCCFMSPEEINVIKNLIKTDKRLKKGKHSNEDVFCDILKAKLRKISKQEHILRLALENLGKTNHKTLISPRVLSKPGNKPQVHVILRNVPNAQREVVILRALGERLEKTLKQNPQVHVGKRSASTITPNMQTSRQLHFILGTLHYAVGRVRVQAVCMHIAFVREFSIANKTINDLKNEKRQFYLPANDKNTELRRTSFKRLRENPKLFMSFLQCKNSLVPFNVLEQDSLFLNSIFYEGNRDSSPSEQLSEEEETVVISEPNDTRRHFMRKEALKIEEIPSTPHENNKQDSKIGDVPSSYAVKSVHFKDEMKVDAGIPVHETVVSDENIFSTKSEKKKKKVRTVKPQVSEKIQTEVTTKIPATITPPVDGTRRCIRKYVTPLPEGKCVSPKNNLVRYTIVGIIELGLFLAIFVSYIYPEIACMTNLRLMKKNV